MLLLPLRFRAFLSALNLQSGYGVLVSLLGSLVYSANFTRIIQQGISASKQVPVGFEVEGVLEEGSLGLACFINTV